ncbi:MAG: PQQ-binding-like beta-propeller repeat protein [Verrucomicrobiales bacterium]|jgi:outer membrane protein assembly factor BamB|nr:PQQ-like beta-propeller repeat protein [Verrucomicrobiales bacterium]MDF1784943.1 PQQ-binding-like beta-propeller repeat protein [Verrucomicrobiales bacterium]
MRILILWILLTGTLTAQNWPGWRGPTGDGISTEKELPTSWSPTENIGWKSPIAGDGHSSPIIWENRVFLTTSLTEKNERRLLCLNRLDGKTLWDRVVLNTRPESIHRLNSRASGTPTTDGTHVYVTFLLAKGEEIIAPNVGSERMITPGRIIVAAYDFEGNEQWKTDVGAFVSAHGFNTCPVLFEDLVIINGDHDGDAYLVALDAKTGKECWRTMRENKTRSYVTPIIREIGNRTQMILSGSLCVASYDPSTGKRHWILDGPTEQFVASMVYNGEHVFVTGGYPQKHILAIDPNGTGNVTDTHITWRTNRGAAYVPSPIVSGNHLLVVADSGVAICFDAKTGDRHWRERLDGGHSPSPVLANGIVYCVSDQGVATVFRLGDTFELIAKNDLAESVSSSPAISQGQLFIRTHQALYCIGKSVRSGQ